VSPQVASVLVTRLCALEADLGVGSQIQLLTFPQEITRPGALTRGFLSHRQVPERAVELIESRQAYRWSTTYDAQPIVGKRFAVMRCTGAYRKEIRRVPTCFLSLRAKMESIREQLNELTGTRESNRDSADVLRSFVTLKYGLQATGLSPTAFGKRYVDRSVRYAKSRLASSPCWRSRRCLRI
jgi:hypothetical protein